MAQPAEKQPEFLTPAQVSKRWNEAVTTGTLANWRTADKDNAVKKYPPFQKFGSRVRYPIDQLVTWEKANLHHANDNQPKE